jgi:hypothetical protein
MTSIISSVDIGHPQAQSRQRNGLAVDTSFFKHKESLLMTQHRSGFRLFVQTALIVFVLLAASGRTLAGHYRLTELANNGTGLFDGGQIFGRPVVNPYTGDVLFAGQDSVSRRSGIYVARAGSVTLVNADPIGIATRRVIEVNKNGIALAVDGNGQLYHTSLNATDEPRTFLPSYLDRGINASIDESDNIYYVGIPEGGQASPSVFAVKPDGTSTRVLDGRPMPDTVFTFFNWGFTGPKVADRGSQTFGPSLIVGQEFLVFIAAISELSVFNTPFAPTGFTTIDGISVVPPSISDFIFQADINPSGQAIYRIFDAPNHVTRVRAAQTWNVPVNNSIPFTTEFSPVTGPPASFDTTDGIAIAKDSSTYAVSADNSITSSWVGGSKSLVVNLGDFLNGRMIVGIEVSERNFVANGGSVAFRARMGDQTSSIVLADADPFGFPFTAKFFETAAQVCLACRLDFPAQLPAGLGVIDPFYVELSKRADTMAFFAPVGLMINSLIIPQLATDGHPAPDAHFTLHFNAPGAEGGSFPQAIDVRFNEPVSLTEIAPNGVTSFFLDSFSDQSDPSLIVGLKFSGDPSGQAVEALVGASELVSIDVRPDEVPVARTRRRGDNGDDRGQIPVAILANGGFNPLTEIDRSSLTFGHSGDEASLIGCRRSDTGDDGREGNRSQRKDLVCFFDPTKTGFIRGDGFGVLKGRTLDGTRIAGSDTVRVGH